MEEDKLPDKRELREITENEKELLSLIHNHLQNEINKNKKLKQNYINMKDQNSPRFFWREGCIDTLESLGEYVAYLQGLKFL